MPTSSTILLILIFGATVMGNDVNDRRIDSRSLLTSLTQNLMARGYAPSAAGSQVVSLNLTNLLVLVLLKTLIFAAGSLGAGTWKGGYGRNLDDIDNKLVTDDEWVLYLSYLSGNVDCMQKIACQAPDQAKKYVAAGDMLLQTSRIMSIDTDTNYYYLMKAMDEAASIGLQTQDCSRFRCGTN